MLAPATIQTLFALARASIRAHLAGEPPPPLPDDPLLAAPRGVFVTLRNGGRLRGCIGQASARRPLGEAVRELAVASAATDRRFTPVSREELPALDVELTVLDEPSPADRARIEVGRHGLLVRRDGRTGLLLPQVAVEQGWDAATFLAATCRKAGLPLDAWQDPATEVLWFTGQAYEDPAPS